jgi:hypothetical protein
MRFLYCELFSHLVSGDTQSSKTGELKRVDEGKAGDDSKKRGSLTQSLLICRLG